MADTSRNIAVITGDLVNSTELGQAKIDTAFAALKLCADKLAKLHHQPLNFTRHRGDGWQVALARPELALRSALAFRAALRANGSEYDSYMGLAEGEIEGDVKTNLNEEVGTLFVVSGALQETLKTTPDFGNRMSHSEGGYVEAAFSLADTISRGWTAAQAQTMEIVLTEPELPNFTAIGDALGISRQAATKHLRSADYKPILWSLRNIEKADA